MGAGVDDVEAAADRVRPAIALYIGGMGAATMNFRYEDSFAQANALEGYERLILLAMFGDQSLFTRADGIERVWEISGPLLTSPPPVQPYAVGTWGPATVDKLIAPHRWCLR